jgi:hypothetical protein
MMPPCVATYHNDGWHYDDEIISYSTDGYRGKVASLLAGKRFVILPKNHYESIDNKKRKRNERLHGKRKKARPTPDDPTNETKPVRHMKGKKKKRGSRNQPISEVK